MYTALRFCALSVCVVSIFTQLYHLLGQHGRVIFPAVCCLAHFYFRSAMLSGRVRQQPIPLYYLANGYPCVDYIPGPLSLPFLPCSSSGPLPGTKPLFEVIPPPHPCRNAFEKCFNLILMTIGHFWPRPPPAVLT